MTLLKHLILQVNYNLREIDLSGVNPCTGGEQDSQCKPVNCTMGLNRKSTELSTSRYSISILSN